MGSYYSLNKNPAAACPGARTGQGPAAFKLVYTYIYIYIYIYICRKCTVSARALSSASGLEFSQDAPRQDSQIARRCIDSKLTRRASGCKKVSSEI